MRKIESQMKLTGKISFRVCPGDMSIIHRQAARHELNVSDYMRGLIKEKLRKIDKS